MRIGNLSRCVRSESGIAYLEFALVLPFLLLLFIGAVEMSRYIIIVQKVEKAASTISDLVAQTDTPSSSQLDILVEAVTEVMRPHPFGEDGYVIITSVSKNGVSATPRINWQYTGGGTWTHASEIGVTGGEANLPGAFTMNDKDTVIIAEVFYNYSPLMSYGVTQAGMIYKFSLYKPRLGGGTTLGL